MGSGAAEATGLGFFCFVVINPCVLAANRVDFGFFCFINFPILLLAYLTDIFTPTLVVFFCLFGVSDYSVRD